MGSRRAAENAEKEKGHPIYNGLIENLKSNI
jgi:hypothetical protein